MTKPTHLSDGDLSKGASENDKHQGRAFFDPARPDIHGNLADQLPHRESDYLNGADSDFPEPGSSPEHTGQKSS